MRLCCFFLLLSAVVAVCRAPAQISAFPWTENFDSLAGPALPPGWLSSDARTPGAADFVITTSSPRSVPHAVISTNATIAQFLAAPLLDFTGIRPDSLRFAVRRSSTHTAGMIVEASLDGGTSYSVCLGDTLWNSGTTSYAVTTCPLPERLTDARSVRLRWRIVPAGSGATGTLRLDDIRVTARASYDMALTGFTTLPAKPREGEPVSAVVTASNHGTNAVLAASVTCSRVATGDTILLASQSVGPLEPGDSAVAVLPLGIPVAGNNLLLAQVTADGDANGMNDTRSLVLLPSLREGSIMINEIMYAPEEAEAEWLELYNGRELAVDIGGWSIADASGVRHSVTAPRFIAPQGFLVLTGDSAAVALSMPPLAPIAQVAGFPSLNNSGDAVVMQDGEGLRVDSLRYDPAWGGNDGRSLERIDAESSASEPANWCASRDSTGSTPGRLNSVARLSYDPALTKLSVLPGVPGAPVTINCTVVNAGRNDCYGFMVRVERLPPPGVEAPAVVIDSVHALFSLPARDSMVLCALWRMPTPGLSVVRAVLEDARDERLANNTCSCTTAVPFAPGAMVINEIMPAPMPGDAEWCELLNAGTDAVDVTGWSLSDRPTGEGAVNHWFIGDTGSVVQSGEYFVVASDSSLFRRYPLSAVSPVPLIKIMRVQSLGLNNDGDDLVLRDCAGHVIDSVVFQPSWHSPALVDDTGHALERIAPHMPSCDPKSWSSCVAPGWGTPGRQNSIFAPRLVSGSRVACAPNPFSPDGDGRDDLTVIHYELPARESLLTISLYSITGYRIRRLVDAEPAGPSGDVPWDGRTDNHTCARVGIYIVLLEAVDQASGDTIMAKTAVILAGRL